jgi:uncharacterized membrane protein
MGVDVSTEIVIQRPIAEVFTFSANPDNVSKWYVNIESVEWETEPPPQVGSRIAFVAKFLGKRLVYTYEIIVLVSEEQLVMRTAHGPFPMETTYVWTATDNACTHMVLRNRGSPAGISKLAAPFMAAAVRKANRKDLERLKHLLEQQT